MMRLNAIKRYDSIALSAQEVSANLSWLKLVAMAAMLLDHIAIAYLQLRPNDALEALLRMPGRISIPAFAFLIAYGYEKFSADRVNYALRLWLFALISEPAYIAFFDKSGNALIPLALGATILLLEDRVRGRFEHLVPLLALLMTLLFAWATREASIVPITVLVWMFHRAIRDARYAAAWGAPIMLTMLMSNNTHWQYMVMIPVTLAMIAASVSLRSRVPVIRVGKWTAYSFYPAHLAVLALVVSILAVGCRGCH